MRTYILIFSLLASSLDSFAQGKVSLQMDLPIVLEEPGHPPGTPFPTNFPVVLVVGLYGGTSSTSLTLQGSAILNPVGGTGTPVGYIPVTHIVTTLPGGVLAWFQVKIWDSAYATYEAQAASGHLVDDYSSLGTYYQSTSGLGGYLFQMSPGSSIAYPPINGGGGSTWVATGNEVSYVVGIVPEPSVIALAALGATTSALYSRRRKDVVP